VIERLSSPGFARTALWLSALVLIAGVVAFVTVRMGSSDDPKPSAAPASTVDGTDFDPGSSTTQPKESDVPKAARKVAGEFILAAAGREDLEKAWAIAHPDLKRECGCTKNEWLTGNINVQYFPTDGLQGAAFTVDEVSPGRVVLEVLLTPKQGSELEPQAFYIGLKQVGGNSGKWLVDYWAPHSAIPVPQQG
jgi:hypothetical protein